MILHTINKPSAWAEASNLINENDVLVMLENGVYLGLKEINQGYAIRADAEARGLLKRLRDGIELIDYGEFVRLCARADKICAWF